MTYEEKQAQAVEYVDMLLTCELAYWFNPDKPNKAIRHALKSISERCKDKYIRGIALAGYKQLFALDWLNKEFKRIEQISGDSVEKFYEITLGDSV